jgi:hypothetical protein
MAAARSLDPVFAKIRLMWVLIVVAQVELCGDLRVGLPALMHVYRSPQTGKPVSRAGAPYAALWVVITGARAAFSYGLGHWFQRPVVNWAIANHVSAAAITDGLIFMALAMVLVRTLALGVRASRLPAAPETAPAVARV